jgi:hypothetical protein
MKPTMQTILPSDTEPLRGDCFRACVASIFELPIEDVPHFCEHPNWGEHLDDWLWNHGMAHVFVRLDVEADEGYLGAVGRGIWCIVSGTTKRHPSRLHSVVARTLGGGVQWEYRHDPHPDGTFLEEAKDILFFISVQPWRLSAKAVQP